MCDGRRYAAIVAVVRLRLGAIGIWRATVAIAAIGGATCIKQGATVPGFRNTDPAARGKRARRAAHVGRRRHMIGDRRMDAHALLSRYGVAAAKGPKQ